MITRPLIATAVAVVAVAGTASAAALTISSQPTLANIVVTVPACDDPTATSVPVTWSPARQCTPTTGPTPVLANTSGPALQTDGADDTGEPQQLGTNVIQPGDSPAALAAPEAGTDA